MPAKKKILHLISTLERGGSEMSLLRMLPLLNDEVESSFITLGDTGSLASRFQEAHIEVIAINQRYPWELASYVRLHRALKQVNPDLVITHLLFPDLVGRFFVQLFTPYKVIASLATTYNFPRYFVARVIERATKYFCTGYMANAESVKRTYVERFKVNPKKITVVPTGMDTEKLKNIVPNPTLQAELGITKDDTVLVCVANLHINKGHRYLLEAFEALHSRHPHTKLLLVGQGQERENLEKQVVGYTSREDILFLGKRSDVPELLALSHIFALPTFFEGMCNAIMEAMTVGLPIVTTDIPENRELVTHEVDGLLVPLKDSEELQKALERLITDKAFAQLLGSKGAQSMEERYGLKKSVERWKAYYLRMSEGNPQTQGLYEENYQSPDYFSFGQNWKRFLKNLTEAQIEEAKLSLTSFLGNPEALKEKTFIDLGCGSGLFSLAAYRLGAKKVVSIDIDESSVWCVKQLHAQAGAPSNWEILTGSALDQKLIESLGQFDVVYSWGVLHHTGNMNEAIENVTKVVAPTGKLFIALYNKNQRFLEGTSPFWLRVKKIYNRSSLRRKRLLETLYADYILFGLLVHGRNPIQYVREYRSLRGMDFWTDIRDWLGGYPYEYASIDEVTDTLSGHGYLCEKINPARSIGCNEFLFSLAPVSHTSEKVAVLISAHNDAETLERSLESIYQQSFQDIQVVFIDDCSTDTSALVAKNVAARFPHIPTTLLQNETNLGLTQSLNRGLNLIAAPYTARLDADDWWELDKLEKQISFLETHPEVGIIGTNYINHAATGEKRVTRPETHQEIERSLFWKNPFAHSTVCYRTELIKNLGGYNPSVRYAQDYELWVRCLPHTQFHNLQEFLCHRTLGTGISVDHQNAQMRLYLKVLFTYLPKYHRPLYEYGAIFEPIAVLLLPEWFKNLKRRLFS